MNDVNSSSGTRLSPPPATGAPHTCGATRSTTPVAFQYRLEYTRIAIRRPWREPLKSTRFGEARLQSCLLRGVQAAIQAPVQPEMQQILRDPKNTATPGHATTQRVARRKHESETDGGQRTTENGVESTFRSIFRSPGFVIVCAFAAMIVGGCSHFEYFRVQDQGTTKTCCPADSAIQQEHHRIMPQGRFAKSSMNSEYHPSWISGRGTSDRVACRARHCAAHRHRQIPLPE